VNSIITLQENEFKCNITLVITILQKYSTGLQRFVGIETNFEFKFKLQTNKTGNIKQQKQ
jgi:hypothetical protein